MALFDTDKILVLTEVHKKRTAKTKKKRADCTKDRKHEAKRARRAVFEAVVAGD